MDSDNTLVFQASESVAYRNIGGDAVLVDIRKNVMLRLNETGTKIWFLLGGKNVEQIAKELCAEFDVSEEAALKDAGAFLSLLSDRGLVTTISSDG